MNLGKIELTFCGHATFRIVTPAGKHIVIDPWLEHNPACPDNLKKLSKADSILITHAHFDHIDDAVALAKRVRKTPIVVKDCAGFLVNRVLFPYMNEALLLLSEGASMDDVARAAGITKASIYHHVSGKEALLDHFKPAEALERQLESRGKLDLLKLSSLLVRVDDRSLRRCHGDSPNVPDFAWAEWLLDRVKTNARAGSLSALGTSDGLVD